MTAAALLLALAAAAAAPESSPPPEKTALDDVFAGIGDDGAVELPDAARQQIIKLLPQGGRGQQCEKPSEIHGAVGLKDRGEGALLFANLHTCRGETVYVFAPGSPVRVAKLFENEEGRKLVSALALPLRGGEGAKAEIGLVLAGRSSEVRFFVRRSEQGFAFAPSGSLPDFSFASQCDEGDHDHVAGHRSLLRVGEARKLWLLRLEQRCGGGLSSVRCEVWHLDQGHLDKRGACAVPVKLDETDLRKSGWW